ADQEQADIAGPTRWALALLALQRANPFQQDERNRNGEEDELIQDLEFFSHRRQRFLRRSIRADPALVGSTKNPRQSICLAPMASARQKRAAHSADRIAR